MKTCLPAIRQLLADDPDVAALVPIDRMFQFWAAQDAAFPNIVLQDITATPNTDLNGSTTPWTRRLSIHCRSETIAGADAVALLVNAVLENFRGVARTFQIQQCMPVSDVAIKDDTSNVVARILDYRVIYSEVP